jgi:hypothetical protein
LRGEKSSLGESADLAATGGSILITRRTPFFRNTRWKGAIEMAEPSAIVTLIYQNQF